MVLLALLAVPSVQAVAMVVLSALDVPSVEVVDLVQVEAHVLQAGDKL